MKKESLYIQIQSDIMKTRIVNKVMILGYRLALHKDLTIYI